MLRTASSPTARSLVTAIKPTHWRSAVRPPSSARGFLTIVRQGTLAYRLTFGRSAQRLEPGLQIFIPGLHTIQHVDMRDRNVHIDSLQCYTSENVPVTVSGSLFFRVLDGEKAIFAVQDYARSTAAIGTSALRSTVGHFSYDNLISNRDLLNKKLQQTIGSSISPWGIECSKFEVQQFNPSNREVEKQLEQQMEAERNRRKQLLDTEASVIVAEGEKKRTILESEAELQSRKNSAEGEFAATAKEGEALAAQILVIARGLAGGANSEPTIQQLEKAADLILELRRQEMLKACAEGAGNHTYFLHEKLGPSAGQEFDTDASEKWKRSIALQAPLMS